MKEKRYLMRVFGLMLCAMVTIGFMSFLLPPAEVQAETITLKVVQSWPKPVHWNRPGEQWMNWAEYRLKGKVKFNVIGGPEAIPTFQQGESVRNGVVDIMIGAINYYSGEMPEVDCLKLFAIPQWEVRQKGVFKFYNELHAKKLNAYNIGNQLPHNVQFHLYTTKPIQKVEDFKGKTIRVTAIYRAFVEAMGGSPATIAPSEVYTALQRGTVDGLGWPAKGLMDLGWHEVIKYRIDPGFYTMDGCVTINLKKWESLPPDVREGLETSMKEHEKNMYAQYMGALEKEIELLTKAGVKISTLPPAEAKKYVDLAYKAGWDELIQKRAPEIAPKVKAMLEK
ncbi:MAG: TRAP transporter substrate-binding protein DctP [Pseudomonadota bacterium]